MSLGVGLQSWGYPAQVPKSCPQGSLVPAQGTQHSPDWQGEAWDATLCAQKCSHQLTGQPG